MGRTCSFLLPVRDAEATLGAAIESARAQSVPAAEIVVVDDGSSDRSVEVARAQAVVDPRVRVIARPRLGLATALQAGLAVCDTPWIARLDADDEAMPERLERQLPVLEQGEDLGVVDGRLEWFGAESIAVGMALYASRIHRVADHAGFVAAFLRDSPVVHPAATLRAEAVRSVGGYRAGAFPEDLDLWHRLERAGYRFARVPEVLVRMRDLPGRATRTDPAYSRRAFRALARVWLLDAAFDRPRRVVLWGGGRGGRDWLRWLREIGSPPVAIVEVARRRLEAGQIDGVPVVEPDALGDLDADLCLVAVGRRDAEGAIRESIGSTRPDWVEGREWWFVATA